MFGNLDLNFKLIDLKCLDFKPLILRVISNILILGVILNPLILGVILNPNILKV